MRGGVEPGSEIGGQGPGGGARLKPVVDREQGLAVEGMEHVALGAGGGRVHDAIREAVGIRVGASECVDQLMNESVHAAPVGAYAGMVDPDVGVDNLTCLVQPSCGDANWRWGLSGKVLGPLVAREKFNEDLAAVRPVEAGGSGDGVELQLPVLG